LNCWEKRGVGVVRWCLYAFPLGEWERGKALAEDTVYLEGMRKEVEKVA